MTLCAKGLHDLSDPANVYKHPHTGRRQCRPCKDAASAAYRAAHRGHRRKPKRQPLNPALVAELRAAYRAEGGRV